MKLYRYYKPWAAYCRPYIVCGLSLCAIVLAAGCASTAKQAAVEPPPLSTVTESATDIAAADSAWIENERAEELSGTDAMAEDSVGMDLAGLSDEIPIPLFKQHILDYLLDTLDISPEDSITLADLSNKRGVIYDVPMVWNDRVRRSLLFFMRTRKNASAYERWLNRATYYYPAMAQMFEDGGLPRDLAYLPIIESAFNPHAYSRARAAGIWQFIPSTGKNYGLRQNYWIDERRDPLKSTGAAMAYLKKLYNDFGDWHIALASYNCGENGMARAIRRADGLHDYWALTLPKETMNYIPLYLASVMVAKNPDVFGYVWQDTATFDRDTVTINDCIEIKTIAAGIGVPADTLKKINPHILHWCTPPDMQNVRLYLPKGYADAFDIFYSELPADKKTKFYRYKIQHGDNMMQIARNFKVPVDALREINNMRTNHITAGKYLIIPIPLNESAPASLSAYINTSDDQKPRRPSTGDGQRSAVPKNSKKISYKVRTGESLYSIANVFGVTVKELMDWNYLANPRGLKAEQTLIIYQTDKPPASPSARQAAGTASEHTAKYVVKRGDTLYGISQEIGISVNELARINALDARRPLIFPGDILVYTPKSGGAASESKNP